MTRGEPESRSGGISYARNLGADLDVGRTLKDHHRWLIVGVLFYVYYAAYVATAIRNMFLHLPPASFFSGADLLAGAWFVGLVITAVLMGVVEVVYSGFGVARKFYAEFANTKPPGPTRYRSKAAYISGLTMCLVPIFAHFATSTFSVTLPVSGIVKWMTLTGLLVTGLATLAHQGLWGARYGLMLFQAAVLTLLMDGRSLPNIRIYAGILAFIVLTFVWWSRELAMAKGVSENRAYMRTDGKLLLSEMRANTVFVGVAYLILLPLFSGILVANRVKHVDPIWGSWTNVQGSSIRVRFVDEPVPEQPTDADPAVGLRTQAISEAWFFGAWNEYVLAVDRSSRDVVLVSFTP